MDPNLMCLHNSILRAARNKGELIKLNNVPCGKLYFTTADQRSHPSFNIQNENVCEYVCICVQENGSGDVFG